MAGLDANLNPLIEDSSAGNKKTSEETEIKTRYDNIKKSPYDKRNYRGILLKNDMKVILVSDNEADECAAALNVAVGYLSDPDYLPGLAHLCEHTLFRGCEKYPDGHDFRNFLSQHGGSSNASTSLDFTSYYFEITSAHFYNALEKFSQYFIKPLFNESAIECELNSIYSEHESNLMQDSWRMDQLDASSANPNHPYSKFGTGDKNSLGKILKEKGIILRDELLKFYNQWYSSNIMTLSIISTESLDEMEAAVAELFSAIENKQIEAPEWPETPFNEHQFLHKWYVVPLGDARVLKIVFPLPDLRLHFRAGLDIYICHLLNAESEGSLLLKLKNEGWCNVLIAGKTQKIARGFDFLCIALDITENGMDHIDDIITLMFQYLNMLRKFGPIEWLFNEYHETGEMDFIFREKWSAQSHVRSIAGKLVDYPFEDVLNAPYLLTEFRPDLINEVMNYLVPKNIRIHVAAKAFEEIATETEFWYGTKFLKEKIAENVIDKWNNAGLNDDFKLPTRNELIPTCFDIKVAENSRIEKYPTIVKENPLMRIWFKQDAEYRSPKIHLEMDFESPLHNFDPVNCNLLNMYILIVEHALSDYAHKADVAGMNCVIDSTSYGVNLSLNGYHDKFHVALQKIMDKIMNATVDPVRFHIFKEYYTRSLKNSEISQPHERANYYLDLLLSEQTWTKAELLDATSYLTVERLQQYISEMFSRLHIEGLIYGNLTESEALELIKIVEEKLVGDVENGNKLDIVPLTKKHLFLHRQMCFEAGKCFLYEVEQKEHKDSCTLVYYQCGLQTLDSKLRLELFHHIIWDYCSNCFRDEEQLGYNIFVHLETNNGVQGLKIVVQSERHPKYIEKKIETCVASLKEYLECMSDEEYDQYKSSLITQRRQTPNTMGGLFGSFWSEISMQQYNFERDELEAEHLKSVTKDQIIEFFEKTISPESTTRTKVVIYITSTINDDPELFENDHHSAEPTNDKEIVNEPIRITDIEDFKKTQALFPLLEPFEKKQCKNDSEN